VWLKLWRTRPPLAPLGGLRIPGPAAEWRRRCIFPDFPNSVAVCLISSALEAMPAIPAGVLAALWS